MILLHLFVLIYTLRVGAFEKVKEGSPFVITLNKTEAIFELLFNDKTFYRSSQESKTYLDEQAKRLNVSELEKTVTLSIENTTRTDSGIYSFVPLAETSAPRNNVTLSVIYPPGPASCELINSTEYPNHIKIYCTATAGYPSGYIVCYDGTPKLHIPSLSTTPYEIQATIFFEYSYRETLTCCSGSSEFSHIEIPCNDVTLSTTGDDGSNDEFLVPTTEDDQDSLLLNNNNDVIIVSLLAALVVFGFIWHNSNTNHLYLHRSKRRNGCRSHVDVPSRKLNGHVICKRKHTSQKEE